MTTRGIDRGLSWDVDGADWPNRSASRFVDAGGVRLHVQQMGQGPVALLVHGTGASTHSWRDFGPALAQRFTVIAPDLPGHAFSSQPSQQRGSSLPGMASILGEMLLQLEVAPSLVVGHSAGAAILVGMALQGIVAPRCVVSLNGALLPLQGLAGQIFSPVARLLVQNSLAPRLFAWRAGQTGVIDHVLRATGSNLDPRGIELYQRLARNPAHVQGALAMMANWDLPSLASDIGRLAAPLLLLAGGDDRTIPPEDAFRVRDRLPAARVEYLRGLGHLAHEERPQEVAELVIRYHDEV